MLPLIDLANKLFRSLEGRGKGLVVSVATILRVDGAGVGIASGGSKKILLVLCEYSTFRIESNSYFTIRFDSKRAQLFEILEYLPSPISYLFNRMTPIFNLSNHA